MKQIIVTILAFFFFTGCTTTKEYSTVLLYSVQHKVLVFVLAPCASVSNNKPALLSKWVREKDTDRLVVACDTNCNCKLVVQPIR
jgi:hypothetical protein